MGNIIIPPTHREDATGTLENQVIECDSNTVSDGYHTFGELYEHRILLYMALLKLHGGWKSNFHHDGSSYDGWFIAGTELNGKPITYHLPIKYWSICPGEPLIKGKEWDGHSPEDVLDRLKNWLG